MVNFIAKRFGLSAKVAHRRMFLLRLRGPSRNRKAYFFLYCFLLFKCADGNG
jgi:hypothetical protein